MTDTPLADTDPDSITALFDRDPSVIPDVDLDRLIGELRHRADAFAAKAAAEAAAPKTTRGGRKPNALVDAALASIADKPIAELDLDDLLPGGGGQ